jgi:hypothetical protein
MEFHALRAVQWIEVGVNSLIPELESLRRTVGKRHIMSGGGATLSRDRLQSRDGRNIDVWTLAIERDVIGLVNGAPG